MLSDRGITGISVVLLGLWLLDFSASHYAIEVMNEEGIDISAHRSKKLQVI